MGNSKLTKLKPHFCPRKNIMFGGKLEEKMIEEFNSLDIIWYASENSEKLQEWRAFTNVNVIKISEESEFKEIISMKEMPYSIIITTGTFAEKTIPKINDKNTDLIILIYCMNKDYHKKWSKEYLTIKGIFTHPEEIFEYLLKFQDEGVKIPLFCYKINDRKEFNFNYYNSLSNEEFLVNQNNFSLKLNKYEKFCLNTLNYFKKVCFRGYYFDIFRLDASKIISLIYGNDIANIPLSISHMFHGIFDQAPLELNNFFIGLTFISLYFSKFPYLFGFLNYKEIEEILGTGMTIDLLRKDYNELYHSHFIVLMNKLLQEKTSILEESIHLKCLHSFIIKNIKYFNSLIKFTYKQYSKYPIMINYLMDIDFCIKFYFYNIYSNFKTTEFKTQCVASLMEVDKRYAIFKTYCLEKYCKETALKMFLKKI